MAGVKRPIKHGTIGGYMAHRRREEAPCGACTTAWRIFYQQYNNALPRTALLRNKKLEKHRKAQYKKNKLIETEKRKVVRRLAREERERVAREAGHQDPSVGVEQVGVMPEGDGAPLLAGLEAQAERPGPAAEQG